MEKAPTQQKAPSHGGRAPAKPVKLSPLAQSVVDQITELDRAGRLGKGAQIDLRIREKDQKPPLDDDLADELEPTAEEEPVRGLVARPRGRMGVYNESDDVTPAEGSMLADILGAITKKTATPPLRNSKGQVAVIRMDPSTEEDI